MGFPPERAHRSIETFRRYDEKLLLRQHAVYQDEARLAETAKQSMEELENLFESDQRAASKSTEEELPVSS